MKLLILLLITIFATVTQAQDRSCLTNCIRCEVYAADMTSRSVLKAIQFSPVTGEEELTNRVFTIPQTKLVVTASVFFTDESMASKAGADSMKLALAVSKHSWSQAFASPNSAVAEVTLGTFDTARVGTNVFAGRKRLLIGMECKSVAK